MNIGSKVTITSPRDMYDCDGEIIGQTEIYWKVKCFNHKTMGVLWDDQKEDIKLFHKKNNLSKGYSKHINTTGSFLDMHETITKRKD